MSHKQGRILRDLRTAGRFTQRELAEAIELPLSLLQHYERTDNAPLYIHLAIHLFIAIQLEERRCVDDLQAHPPDHIRH